MKALEIIRLIRQIVREAADEHNVPYHYADEVSEILIEELNKNIGPDFGM